MCLLKTSHSFSSSESDDEVMCGMGACEKGD